MRRISEKKRSIKEIERYLVLTFKKDRFLTAIYNNELGYEGTKVHGRVIKRGDSIYLRYRAAKSVGRKKLKNKGRKTYMKEGMSNFPLSSEAEVFAGENVIGVISVVEGRSKVSLMAMPEHVYVNPKTKRTEHLMDRILIRACIETMQIDTFSKAKNFIKDAENSFHEWEEDRRRKQVLERSKRGNKNVS